MFGVVSWGEMCAFIKPGVYADVPSKLSLPMQTCREITVNRVGGFVGVKSWIESNTGGEC